MSRHAVSRREFLTVPFLLAFLPLGRAWGELAVRHGTYEADVSLLYGVWHLAMTGSIDEQVDRAAGRYTVTMAGQGSGMANRIESTGTLREGRWAPVRATAWFEVRGRESRSEIAYDYGRRRVDYHFRGETFFRRRLRVVDDVVPIPETVHVDDVVTATLNYADKRWPPLGDGSFHTQVVRRRRRDDEGPDDVSSSYRAELAPFVLRVAPDATSGKPTALFDMTRFSSWARSDEPARIVFGPERRPELIASSLILGTSITVKIAG
jgi:hypothetical protein